jgi:hypothetical protein
MLSLIIKALQGFRRERGVGGSPMQFEMLSSPCYGDIQHCFYLPEVFIQYPAQVCKTLVIGRSK